MREMGYVEIPKRNFSCSEGINSVVVVVTFCFRRFGSICRRYDHSYRHLDGLSRDDRAGIATCSLRTATDRCKALNPDK